MKIRRLKKHSELSHSYIILITLVSPSLDRKDRMEAENQSMVLTFGSQLDQKLKDLHKIILGSVSQHQEQLKCMEEHAHTYLASKSDVRKKEIFVKFWCLCVLYLINHNLLISGNSNPGDKSRENGSNLHFGSNFLKTVNQVTATECLHRPRTDECYSFFTSN